MKNIFLEITARTMKQNRTRTVVTVIGVILSTAMLTAVTVFAGSLQSYLVQQTVETEGAWHVDIDGLSRKEIDDIRKDDRVAKVSVVEELGYFPADEDDGFYNLIMSREEDAWKNLPIELDKGRLPEKGDEILIPYDGIRIAGQEVHTGDTVVLPEGEVASSEGQILKPWEIDEAVGDEDRGVSALQYIRREPRTFTVTGIYSRMPETDYTDTYYGSGYVLLAGPQENGEEETCSRAFIQMKNPRQADSFIAHWLGSSEDGETRLENVKWSRHDSLLRWQGVFRSERYVQLAAGMLGTLILVIMAGSVSLIYNSFSISLRERTSQMGILSSVGATKKQLRKSLRFEAMAVSAWGIPAGLLAGVAGTAVTLHFIGDGLTAIMYGGKGKIPLRIEPLLLGAAALLAFATVLISVWLPFRRIRKISPMDAIRSVNDIRIRPKEVKGGRLAGRLFGLEGMLASKNYGRDRKKYRSTVVSLTISIVLLTTAALFTMYLTRAGGVILDPPEYELRYSMILTKGEGDEDALREAEKILKQESGVEEYKMYKYISISIPMEEDMIGEAYAGIHSWNSYITSDKSKVPFSCEADVLPDDEYEAFLKEQGLEEPVVEDGIIRSVYYDQIRAYDATQEKYEQTSSLSEKVKHTPLAAGRYLSSEGDSREDGMIFQEKLEVEFDKEAKNLPPQLADRKLKGVIMILSENQFEQYMSLMYPAGSEEYEASYVAEYPIKASDYRNVRDRLEEKLQNLTEQYNGILQAPAEDAELNRQAVKAIQVLCYGFIALISLIAVANVFNTISTNLMLRRREFAMLRSVGMTGGAFRRMMGYECIIYGIRSLVYGTVLSLGISLAFWRFTSRAGGVESFLFPWAYFLAAVAGVFAIVFITMLYTMHKIRKMNIIEELRIE